MTGTEPDIAKLIEQLAQHDASDAMARFVRQAAMDAAQARRTRFPLSASADLERPPQHEPDQGEASEDWTTPWGNPRQVLESGASSAQQVALITGLLALGLRHEFPSTPETEQTAAANVLWLASHTTLNAFEASDHALGEGRQAFWQNLANLIVDPKVGGADFGKTEALVGAAALRSSEAEAAKDIARRLSAELGDPVLSSVLFRTAPPAQHQTLSGELAPTPKGPVLTAVLAVTLLLAIGHAARLIARYVFSYKRPAKMMLSQRGLEVTYHTELLGKVLRERATLVPLDNLASVTREVRFARIGMYAGLVALVIGSYVGVGLLIDGLRVPGGSATLLGLAVLLILAGLLIDFGLSSLSDSVRGKCRIVVVPRKGRSVCIGALNSREADAVLGSIADQVRA